jgi:UDP-N-acetylglucosamine 2-epimerase
MHPSEKDFYFYERIKKATQADNVTIIKDFNTPQLLHDATTVVTTISTTGDEAIFLGKPLIVVNLTNEPDFMPYAGSRAAITVREKSKVFEAVRSVIYDRAIREELQAGRREYIAEHLLSDDGMSAIRCVQVLLSMINKQQQEANGKKQS